MVHHILLCQLDAELITNGDAVFVLGREMNFHSGRMMRKGLTSIRHGSPWCFFVFYGKLQSRGLVVPDGNAGSQKALVRNFPSHQNCMQKF